MNSHAEHRAPIVEFPAGIVDMAGRPLRPGVPVRFHRAGRSVDGIVSRYNPERGVEIYTDDDEVVPALPGELERLGAAPDDTLAGVTVVDPDQRPTTLVVPLGPRDLQTLPADPGPLPARGPRAEWGPTADWAEACTAALEGLDADERRHVLAAHLDAPILRRALTEGLLPRRLERLVLVCTAQTPPHPGDTAPLVPLVVEWLAATSSKREREIAHPVDVVRVTVRPDIIADVHGELTVSLSPLLVDADRVAVVHAGGTPATALAATLVAATRPAPVRLLQVLRGGRVTEIDLGPLAPDLLRPPPRH